MAGRGRTVRISATGANTMPLGANSGFAGGNNAAPTTKFGATDSGFGNTQSGFASAQGGFGDQKQANENVPQSFGNSGSRSRFAENSERFGENKNQFTGSSDAPSQGRFGESQGQFGGGFGGSNDTPSQGRFDEVNAPQGQFGGFGGGASDGTSLQGGFVKSNAPSGFGSSDAPSQGRFGEANATQGQFGGFGGGRSNYPSSRGEFGESNTSKGQVGRSNGFGGSGGPFGESSTSNGQFGASTGAPSGRFGESNEHHFGALNDGPIGGFGGSSDNRPPKGFGNEPRGQGSFGADGGSRGQFGDGQRRRLNEEGGERSFGERGERNGEDGNRPPRPVCHIPVNRDLSEIFDEDEKSRNLYSGIVDDDEAVEVEGLKGPVAVMEKWSDIVLEPEVMKNIERSNYIRPRKIQAYSIPIILAGHDIKGQAETGSGKSAAFLIPLINQILKIKKVNPNAGAKNRPQALIIEPTRELALQLYEQGRKLASDTGVQVVKSYGQYDFKKNAEEIIMGCDIVVGTPGRVMSFIEEGIIDLEFLQYFVLDEADRMLEGEFKEDMLRMSQFKGFPQKDKRQTLLFSATFPADLESFANEILKDDHVKVHNKHLVSVNSKIEQEFIECEKHRKRSLLLDILTKEMESAKANDPAGRMPRTLVFVERKRDADVMSMYLCQNGVKSTTINGDRPQHLREVALREFRSYECPVLVATDVCARGLDIKDLDYVVNMDLPKEITTYVHRIGRTGRLKKGKATSFFDSSTDADIGQELEKLLIDSSKEVPEFIKNAKSFLPEGDMTFSELPGAVNVNGFD